MNEMTNLYLSAAIVFAMLVFAIVLLVLINKSKKVREFVYDFIFEDDDEEFEVIKVDDVEEVLFVNGDIYEKDFTDFKNMKIHIDEYGNYHQTNKIDDFTKTLLMKPNQIIPENGRMKFTGFMLTADEFMEAKA